MLQTLIFREYRYKDNISELINELNLKLQKDPNNVDILEQLAEIYHAYKENDKAIEIYEKIDELKPKDSEIKAYLGYLYYEGSYLDKAEKYLLDSLNINPEEPFVLYLLGNVLSRKGRVIEAINYYELAVFFDFDLFTAHIDFGRKYEHMGRHKKALQEYNLAYEIDPTDTSLKEKIAYLKEKVK